MGDKPEKKQDTPVDNGKNKTGLGQIKPPPTAKSTPKPDLDKQRRDEEERKRRAAEERRRRQQQADDKRRRDDADAKRRSDDADAKRRSDDADAKRRREDADRRRKQEADSRRRKQEEDDRKKAENRRKGDSRRKRLDHAFALGHMKRIHNEKHPKRVIPVVRHHKNGYSITHGGDMSLLRVNADGSANAYFPRH